MKNGFTLIWIMVLTSTKFTLNKRALDRKSVSAYQNEASIQIPFPLARKTASTVRNWKNQRKLIYTNFKNDVHQQKKNNKSTRFLIDRKPVSTSQNAECRMLKKAISLDQKTATIRAIVGKNWRKRFPQAEIRFL